MELVKNFISKRNKVRLVREGTMLSVIKSFKDRKILEKEIEIYSLLKEKGIPCASVLASDSESMTLSFIDGDTCQAILDKVEEINENPDMGIWDKLVDWIVEFNRKTGLIIEDSNLRNFIVSKNAELYALDFESCEEGKAFQSVASICAFILLSYPENTEKKQAIVEHISEYFCEQDNISREDFETAINAEKDRISVRRQAKSTVSRKITENCSAIILAGGENKRMGKIKADLKIGDKTFVQFIVNKLKAIGITDIMISGYSKPVDGARNIDDIYTGRGPLSGIYSCMCSAENPNCLVISVDSPLIPKKAILNLIKEYKTNAKNATVLECNGDVYFVLGMYSTTQLKKMEEVLKGDKWGIRKAFDENEIAKYSFTGDSLLVGGCNTPEEYENTIKVYSELEKDYI